MAYINRKRFRQIFRYELRDKLKLENAYDKDKLEQDPYNYIAYVVDTDSYVINSEQGYLFSKELPLLRERINRLENEFVRRVIKTLELTAKRHELDYDDIVWDDAFVYSIDDKYIVKYNGLDTRKHIIIPTGVEGIVQGVFEDYGGRIIIFPETLKEIGKRAFKGWPEATHLTLPDSIEILGEGAFEGWSSLEVLYLPGNISELVDNLFKDSYNLTKIVFPDSIGVLGDSVFENSGLSGKLYLNKVHTLGNKTFLNNASLKEVIIGEDFLEMGDETFANCENLVEMTVLAETPPQIGQDILMNSPNVTIYVYDSLVDTYRTDAKWIEYSNKIEPLSTRGS